MASLRQTTPISSFRSPTASASAKLSLRSRSRSLSFAGSASFPALRVPSLSRRGGGVARMSATAASSYAQALADVAKSGGTLEATSADVEKVEKIFADPQVLKFFANPTIAVEKKREVVRDLATSSSLQPFTANFINILIDSGRVDIIGDIVKEFESVYNRITDTELAVVSSVVPLESQHLAQIAKQVQKLTGAKNVRIKTAIEPSLVAGFTVRFGNSGSKLIDLSVKKQLEEIASQLELGDIQLV